MALTAQTLLGGLGALTGGRSEVQVQAAGARIVERASAIRADILKRTEALGERIGPTLGGDFFAALAKGSDKTASAARADESARLFGVKMDPRLAAAAFPIGAAVAVGLLLYLLYKATR